MSESYIQVPPDSTGRKIRTIERTVGANVVQEKAITLVEPVSGVVIDPRFTTSGNIVVTSGQVRALTSGDVVAVVSGSVKVHSGLVALYSGGFVSALVSGTVMAKSSGEIYETRPTGYSYSVVSGAVLVNVVSGQVVLHTVTITDRTSGYYMRVRDASSGALGTIIAMPYAQSRAVEPTSIIFDCVMLSGIVVDTSGATWHATVTYRKPF